MEYNFGEIERKWKAYWNQTNVYKVSNDTSRPKCYVLDMFPYPSGAGLHVGHPLGYIASDIYARYKRLKGFNVLHPMGFDAFGLPAEQYALETGQHPADTTEKNIARYREQLDNIGFCYDWSREVRTSDAKYYKWTQWIFLQLFHSWYDRAAQKARPISELTNIFAASGNAGHPCPGDDKLHFDAATWSSYSAEQQRAVLMHYRLAYQGHAQVWWCEALGTVLANDEVVNGVSERGGHPVERKLMRQWFLRITEYADRLLSSLDNLDWSDAMKEMQRNWIGKSSGAIVRFNLSPSLSEGEGDDTQDQPLKPGWNTADTSMYNLIGEFRAELKANPTEAEKILWQHLRASQMGVKFRKQHIIGRFIADFVCLPAKLIIEIDGKIHDSQIEADAERTAYLEEKGFKVIRFKNEEVISNTGNVVNEIRKHLSDSKSGLDNPDADNTSLSFGEGRGEVSVFTTRPDTIFGVDFLVLAPEHTLVDTITTDEQRQAIDEYRQYVKSRSERERMSEVKQVTGCFTGAYAIHPLTHNRVPVWIAEYVLAGYGTGAIMAVPSGDDRDHAFAKHFNIPITNIFGDQYSGEAAYSDKSGNIHNSGFLTGMSVKEATEAAISALEKIGSGTRRTNYRLRDAGFSRQRYWGEPFPIVYINDIPYATDEAQVSGTLPVELPHVKSYKPGPEGQGPLANVTEWVNTPAGQRETNTMPGYAGSSWYFLRYMDPHNDTEFAGRAATDYWNQVDIYVGGTEHAVGHLLYSRMWTKVLYDLGHIGFDEPFKKLLNQGMIQGSSRFMYFATFSVTGLTTSPSPMPLVYVSKSIADSFSNPKQPTHGETYQKLHETIQNIVGGTIDSLTINNTRVDISLVNSIELDITAFRSVREKQYRTDGPTYLVLEDFSVDSPINRISDGKYLCGAEVEKMSKSKYNVVNPDDIVKQYGADTFRMYEMFLGPIEVSKPWDTKGIEGVHRFLKKFWRLYNDEQSGFIVTDEAPTVAELRTLHKTLKKVSEDIERFSFNTCVSQFMICVNELASAGCHKRAILEPLAVALASFAPHITEELWHQLGHTTTVLDAAFPEHNDKFIAENSVNYAVSINGKKRAEIEFALDAPQADIEAAVLADATVQKWMEGKPMKKFIFVKGKMINVVV